MVRLLLLVLLLAATEPARANGAPERARERFRSGVELAEGGDWPGALAAFRTAYELSQQPAVLFNLAGAQLRCGKLLAANSNYRRLLAHGSLDGALRRAATRQVALLEKRIPRLRLRIVGLSASDRLLLDQLRLYPDELDRDMWVDPGAHVVTIYRETSPPQKRTLVVAEGERRVLLLSLP